MIIGITASSILVALLTSTGLGKAEVVRTEDGSPRVGHYQTLVMQPSAAQRDLLSAVINIDFAPDIETVGQAVEVLLKGSGYRLTDAPCQEGLFGLPLPSVHRKLGPPPLQQALEILGGPGWQPVIDPANRLLSFDRIPPGGSDRKDGCHCA